MKAGQAERRRHCQRAEGAQGQASKVRQTVLISSEISRPIGVKAFELPLAHSRKGLYTVYIYVCNVLL